MYKVCFLTVLFASIQATQAEEITFTPNDSQSQMQLKINKAKYSKLVFSPGVYTNISTLTVYPSQVSHISAHGAKFLLPPSRPKFNRYFNILWSSTEESPAIVFDGGEFDMNEQNQGRVSYNKEHQAAIFVDSSRGGKLNLTLRNITIRNSAGDGVSFYRNVMGSLENLKINDCFRGGLTVSGPGNEVIGEDLDLRGDRFRSGIRIEPYGYNNRQIPAVYSFSNIRMNWFDFQLGKGTAITVNNSRLEPINPKLAKDGFHGYIYNEGGEVSFSDCLFYSNRPMEFMLTGNSKFVDCSFHLTQYNEQDTTTVFWPINLRWYYKPAGDFNRNQRCVIDSCDFSMSDIGAYAQPYLIRSFETNPYGGEKNYIFFKDVRVESGAWRGFLNYAGNSKKTRMLRKDCMYDDIKIGDRD